MKGFLKFFLIISLCQLIPTMIFMSLNHLVPIFDLTMLQLGCFGLLSTMAAMYFYSKEEKLKIKLNDTQKTNNSIKETLTNSWPVLLNDLNSQIASLIEDLETKPQMEQFKSKLKELAKTIKKAS